MRKTILVQKPRDPQVDEWFLKKFGRIPNRCLERITVDSMKFRREEVLSKLKENRTKHEAAYNDAVEGYREAVVKDLTESLKLAKAGKEYRTVVKQTEPKSHIKEYDRAILMFEMSADDAVELSEHEFTQFVMDEWNWKEQFIGSARTYGKGSY